MSLLHYLLGFGSSLIIVVFIGWLDVTLLKKPMKKLENEEPIKLYTIVSAWELLFVLMGVIIGGVLF